MSLPGPALGPWLLALVVFAAAAAVVGGAVRTVVRRWVPSWRSLGPIERLLLDVYLGGAALYTVALLPLGLFGPVTFPALTVLAGAVLAIVAWRRGRRAAGEAVRAAVRRLIAPEPALAVVAAAALGVFELAVAFGVPSGNTYDASQLGTYTGLLLSQHSLPTTLSGAGLSLPVVYPQGTTVWMGAAQLLFSLPPARTAILVTPMFFALVPLGAFAVGARWGGSDRAGATVALTFALLASWTRFDVSGSYDFVAAFPLLLLLVGLSRRWVETVPDWREAIAFGLLAGFTASLSPVGVGWWLVALPVVAAVAGGAGTLASAGRWLRRYIVVLLAATLPILPSLAAVAVGAGHLGFSANEPGVGTLAPVGLTGPEVVGYTDPFLFRSSAPWLSPFPILQVELAALLVVGAAWLVLRWDALPKFPSLAALAFGGATSAAAWYVLQFAAGTGVPGTTYLAPLTNGEELAELLSTIFVLVAAVPLLAAWGPRPAVPRSRESPERTRSRGGPVPLWPLLIGLLLLAPGLAVTAVQAPPALHGTYESFGNLSADDFGMLTWCAQHLPSGAAVLVDPGSAAEFLTAYDPSLRVLYPMVVGFEFPNATYRTVVAALTNGTLNASVRADILSLSADFVVVTERNSVLGAPFALAPFLDQPAFFPTVHHQGDAYVFQVERELGLPFAAGDSDAPRPAR